MSCIADLSTTHQMYFYYQEVRSLARVAQFFGVSRQSVFKRFKRQNLQLFTKPPRPSVTWNGVKYTLRSNGYFARTKGSRSYLHRDVWASIHGPIPDGFDVHHVDENKQNNDPSNLDLMTLSEHGKRHGFGGNQTTGPLGRRPVKW